MTLTELRYIVAVARERRLNGYEHIKAVHLDPVPFTLENDLLTPTFKLKRHQARIHYAAVLDGLYRELDESAVVARGPGDSKL